MNDIYLSEAHVCSTVNGDAGPECAAPMMICSSASAAPRRQLLQRR